ncbi:MAG: hypothetical protein QM642_03995 [Edaphocola sp.]
MSGLFSSRHSGIRHPFDDRASQKAPCRFFNNEKVTGQELVSACRESTPRLCAGKHILVVDATTEINLQGHAGRLREASGIGLVGNNKDLGVFAHLGLAIDMEAHQAIGFSSMRLWHWEGYRQGRQARQELQGFTGRRQRILQMDTKCHGE